DAQGGSRQGMGKKTELAARVAAEGRFPMKTIADMLDVARSHLHERVHQPAAPHGPYCKAADEQLLPLIRRLADDRPTYSYRRVTALDGVLATVRSRSSSFRDCALSCEPSIKPTSFLLLTGV